MSDNPNDTLDDPEYDAWLETQTHLAQQEAIEDNEHAPIEFPSSPIRADTDKPKKRRRKKSDQLDMFGQ